MDTKRNDSYIGIDVTNSLNVIVRGGPKGSKLLFLGDVNNVEDVVELCKRHNCTVGVMDTFPEVVTAREVKSALEGITDLWLGINIRMPEGQSFLHFDSQEGIVLVDISRATTDMLSRAVDFDWGLKEDKVFDNHFFSMQSLFNNGETFRKDIADKNKFLHTEIYSHVAFVRGNNMN